MVLIWRPGTAGSEAEPTSSRTSRPRAFTSAYLTPARPRRMLSYSRSSPAFPTSEPRIALGNRLLARSDSVTSETYPTRWATARPCGYNRFGSD